MLKKVKKELVKTKKNVINYITNVQDNTNELVKYLGLKDLTKRNYRIVKRYDNISITDIDRMSENQIKSKIQKYRNEAKDVYLFKDGMVVCY